MNQRRSTAAHRSPRGLIAACALIGALTVEAHAQPSVRQLDPGIANDGFGAAIATGDFDGNGFDDIAVGAPGVLLADGVSRGKVEIWYGGPDAQPAVEMPDSAITAPLQRQILGFGVHLAAGDFDGDGRTDLLAADTDGQLWLMPAGDPAGNAGAIPLGTRETLLFAQGLGLIERIEAIGRFSANIVDEVLVIAWSGDSQLCPCDGVVDGGRADRNTLWLAVGTGDVDDLPVLPTPLAPPLETDPCACRVDPTEPCLRQCAYGEVLAPHPFDDSAPLAIGAPGFGPAGEVHLYAPGGGAPDVLEGPAGGEYIGRSLAWVGDPREGLSLLVSADLGEYRYYPAARPNSAQAEDGALPDFTYARFTSGHFAGGDAYDLIALDDEGQLAHVYYDATLPLGEPDGVIRLDEGIWWGPAQVVGEMNGVDGGDLAFTERLQTPNGPEDRVRLYLDGLAGGDDDRDGDGRADGQDNCPGIANSTQIDRDFDGRGDPCDPCPDDPADDGDGDGLCAPLCMGDAGAPLPSDPEMPLRLGDLVPMYEAERIELDDAELPPSLFIDGASPYVSPAGRAVYATEQPERGIWLSLDPYAYGLPPTHIAVTVGQTCDGPLWLTAYDARGRVAAREYDDGQIVLDEIDWLVGFAAIDGLIAIEIRAFCAGLLAIADVQFGRAAEPLRCADLAAAGPGDNCPAAFNPDQADADDDGIGDACDCAGARAADGTDCAPRRTVRGLDDRGDCGGDGDLSSASVFEGLRHAIVAKGHGIGDEIERFDADSAAAGEVIVLTGTGPEGDAEWCALERFLAAGGGVLDVRDMDRSLAGIVATGALDGEPLTCAQLDDSRPLCGGVEPPLAHGDGNYLSVGIDGRRVLVTDEQTPRALAVAYVDPSGGRLLAIGDEGMAWGKHACGRFGSVHEPATGRFVRNAIDFVARAEGFDPQQAPAIERCYDGPIIGELPPLQVAVDSDATFALALTDGATPVEHLDVDVDERAAEEDELLRDADARYDEGAWRLVLTAGSRAGQGRLRVEVTDRDGDEVELETTFEVICPEGAGGCGACAPGAEDRDGDGVCDAADNCPGSPNPEQENADGDIYGDVCDTDHDPDADGFSTPWELALGTDPYVPDANADGDRWPDSHDYCVWLPDPEIREFGPDDQQNQDADGDGIGDACDRNDGTSGAGDPTQGLRPAGGCRAFVGRPAHPRGGAGPWWLALGLGLLRVRARRRASTGGRR